LRNAYHNVLEVLADSYQREASSRQQERAWKLLILMWRMLLRRTSVQGHVGKEEFNSRFERFEQGRWTELLEEAAAAAQGQVRDRQHRQDSTEQLRAQKLERANALVKSGALSKARQCLSSGSLAPGDAATLAELTNPTRRPPAPTTPMPQEARTYQPRVPVQLDRKIWADTLRTASKGFSASLSGTTFEMLQVA